MNILDVIASANGGQAISQLGSQVGLDQDQTASALSALVPALAAGFQRNIQSPEGLGSLVSALGSGNHQQYLDDPTTLGDPQTIDQGNGILGHVLGSREVSRDVASRAASQTGLSPDVLKRLLPLAATLMMGALAKQQAGGAVAPGAGLAGQGGGIAAMLTPLLDGNRDGSIVDDVTGMLGRFLGR